MMTLHGISAGSGVDYLMSTVATGDVADRLEGQSLSDYLSEHGDAPGQWLGRAAGLLGLDGEVSQAAADAVFKYGINPRTGESLGRRFPKLPTAEERFARLLAAEPQASIQRREQLLARAQKAGNASAKSGWEMVFSPVNSFSAAWGLSDDAGRMALAAVEEKAFRTVVALIEDRVAHTRLGAGGAAQVKAAGIVAAVFVHRSSRAGDPTYHRHLAVSAKVPYLQDGAVKWLALDAQPLHEMAVALSERYTAEIERGLCGLGLLAARRGGVERGGKRPVRELVGVDARVLKKFSSRRTQTEAAYARLHAAFLAREGREPTRAESYRMAQTAALTGRPHKKHRGIEEERADWRRRAEEAGLQQPERILQQARTASVALKAAPLPQRSELPDLVVAALSERAGSWRRSNIEAETIRALVATGWHLQVDDFDELLNEVVDAVAAAGVRVDAPALVPAPGAYARADGTSVFRAVNADRFTSRALLDAEHQLVTAALAPADVPTLSAAQVERALAAGDAARGFTAGGEQREVVAALFATDRRVSAVLGRAGTGKTTIMSMVREVAAAHGLAVLGLSTGQVQADQLAAEAGLRAENIARWRTMSENVHPGHPEWTLAPGTIVIVDEAGQAGTLDLAALLTQVQNTPGARLLLVGDPLQTGSVAAGGILAELEAGDAPTLELTDVRRFRDADGRARDWETEASLALAHGQADAAFDAYHRRGRLSAGDAEAMAEAAYRGYVRDSADGLSSILIAPDNAAAAFSARVRAARIETGLVVIGFDGEAELSDGNRAAVGDVVATRRNDRRIRTAGGRGYVRNGDTFTVQRVGQDGSLQVKDRISGALAVLPPQYVAAHTTLGYAVTQHRAQGLTVDTAHALVRAGMTRNGLYPALTRGRYANHAYIELTEPVDSETGQPGERLTARQVWAGVVERDGTERTASALIRDARERAGNLGELYAAIRYVLADLGAARIETLARGALGEPFACQVTAAPGWPALAQLLTDLEAEGGDPAAILCWAAARRDFTGALDLAAVLHARITEHPGIAEVLARRTVADVQVAPGAMLHLLGIVPPPAAVSGQREDFARALAHAALERIELVTDQALAQTAAATGWAAAYGARPADVDAAAEHRARLQAAAVYRDLTGRRDERDPLGPPPPVGQSALRTLWRRARMPADPADLRARALAAADAGEAWTDVLGPAPYDPALYPAWAAAASALVHYREMWGIEHETAPLGQHPTDRVQGADHDHTRRLLQTWRAIASTAPPGLTRASDEQLREAARQGAVVAADARTADQARADLFTARRRHAATAQADADAANRLAAARTAGVDPDRLAELQAARDRAAVEHHAAAAALDLARDLERRYGPAAVISRHIAAEGQAAISEQERRAAETAASDFTTAPTPPWGRRPAGRFTDAELLAAVRTARGAIAAYQRYQQMARAAAEHNGPAVTRLRQDAPLIAQRAAAIEQVLATRADLHAALAMHTAAQREHQALAMRRDQLDASRGREARRAAPEREQLAIRLAIAKHTLTQTTAALEDARTRLTQAKQAAGPQGTVRADGRGEWDLILATRDRQCEHWPAMIAEAQLEDQAAVDAYARRHRTGPVNGEKALSDLAILRTEAAIRDAMNPALRRAEDAARLRATTPAQPGPRSPRRPSPSHRPPQPPGQRRRGPGLGR